MAEGDEKENEAKRKMQAETVKLFQRRKRDDEIVDTDSSRIAMPSLSHKWQTIIDDTLVPQLSKQSDTTVRRRSRSITPDDKEKKKPRPLSMPNTSSPLEIYDVDNTQGPPRVTEVPVGIGSERESNRRPARLDPIEGVPPPPSYHEAVARDVLPQPLPKYGRLWQMGRIPHKESINGSKPHSRREPLDIIEPYSRRGERSYAAGPLAAIGLMEDGAMKETTFSDLDIVAARTSAEIDPQPRNVIDAEEGRNQTEDASRFKCDNCFGDRFPRVVKYLNSLTTTRLMILVVVVTAIIGLILFLGLFPASFVYVEYHEMALLKNKVTGSVDRDTVYFTGCYVLGPDKEFVRFPISATTISKTIGVFTVDRLAISLSFHLQYYIRSNELGDLHREYENGYDEILQAVVKSEIKNHVSQFGLEYFRLNRTGLESFILKLLKTRLQGDCCESCCPSSCTNNTLCATCRPPIKCFPGYHVDIKYFQLTEISVPDLVSDLYLQKLTLQVKAEKEFLVQDYTIVKKETEQKTKKLKNEANELLEAAKADASRIQTISEAYREANMTSAYVYGLSFMYLTLGVTDEQHKLSLMMMRALEDANVRGNLYRGYGYNTSTIISST